MSNTVLDVSLISDVVRRIQHDIEINKKLVGIDFSQFLGDVLNVASTFLFPLSLMSEEVTFQSEGVVGDSQYGYFAMGNGTPVRELLAILMMNVLATSHHLEVQFGRRAHFIETTKALTSVGLIPIRNAGCALEELEAFVLQLMSANLSPDDGKVNQAASEFFLKSLSR